MIRSLGQEVELAAHGGEAIDTCRESMASGKRFDIVILDLTIRSGTGGEKAIGELIQDQRIQGMPDKAL